MLQLHRFAAALLPTPLRTRRCAALLALVLLGACRLALPDPPASPPAADDIRSLAAAGAPAAERGPAGDSTALPGTDLSRLSDAASGGDSAMLPGADLSDLARAPDVPAPPPLAREFRAAWISPVWGGEWPSRPGLSTAEQQTELLALLDRARDVGLNAVMLHVRTAADAFYPTELAPWSVYLTGERGRAPEPFYDPLAFAIEAAHARGLELHAWFNPFRAEAPDHRSAARRAQHDPTPSEWVVRYGAQRWIDPGIPAARAAVLAAILEVVDRYDVDGVHLDDYFYPYREEETVRTRVRGSNGGTRTVTRRRTIPFPDDASWRKYGGGEFTSRADWRRHNIDTFVAELYREVKARRPWVAVGISPFGIWRSGYPKGITGLDAYAEIYADARRWWREGWVDYLAPQLYWPIVAEQPRFLALDEWWRAENVQRRHLWPGLYTSRETDISPRWPAGEIASQIDTLRAHRAGSGEADGHVHFRLHALRSTEHGGIGDVLRATTYASPALVPAMPWLGSEPPATPRARVERTSPAGDVVLRIAPDSTQTVRWWLVQLLVGDEWQAQLYPASSLRLSLAADEAARALAISAIGPSGMQSGTVLHLLGPPTTAKEEVH